MNGTDSGRTAGTPTGEESSAIASKVLAAAAFLAFPLVILAHKGLAPLLVLAALAVFANAAVNRTLNWRAGPFSWAYLALVIYAGLSAAWSIAPKEALTTVPSVAAIGLGGVILIVAARQFSSDARMSVRRALILGGAAGIAILTYEILTAGELIRIARDALGLSTPQERHVMLVFNSALSVGAIFLWPWLAAIRRAFSVRWAAAGALAASAALIVSQADAPKFAAIAGFVLFGAAWMSKRGLAMALSAVIIAGIAAAPVIAVQLPNPLVSIKNIEFLSPSAQHRLVIWRTTAEHIEKKPIQGHGFDTARALYSGADAVLLRFAPDEPEKTWVNHFAPIPLHPHNGVLQIWLELGGIGALILCALMISVVLAIERNIPDRFDRSMAYGALGSGAFVALVSFGVWQNWWLCGMFLCAVLMTAVAEPAAATGGG